MQVILLENIRKLGQLGETVDVKPGYGRNYLIPFKKAVSATKENLVRFTEMRAKLEQQAKEKLAKAHERLTKLENKVFTIAARSADAGKLYGSIGIREVADAIINAGTDVQKSEISLPEGHIRTTGEFKAIVLLHTDVECTVTINVIEEK